MQIKQKDKKPKKIPCKKSERNGAKLSKLRLNGHQFLHLHFFKSKKIKTKSDNIQEIYYICYI